MYSSTQTDIFGWWIWPNSGPDVNSLHSPACLYFDKMTHGIVVWTWSVNLIWWIKLSSRWVGYVWIKILAGYSISRSKTWQKSLSWGWHLFKSMQKLVFLVCEQKTNMIKDNKPTTIFMFSQTMQDKMSRNLPPKASFACGCLHLSGWTNKDNYMKHKASE